MNATEFLKLVEKYPLPWRIGHAMVNGSVIPGVFVYYEGRNARSDCEEVLDTEETDALADAAPTMAAAILGLASRVKRAETGAVFDMEVEIEALCAALPEELRP